MSWGKLLIMLCLFFFSSRRRHTRFDCDWSSDVCSSDLSPERAGRIRVELHSFFARGLPSRPQGFQTGPYADSLTEHLSSYRGSFAIQRVQDSKFEPIHREAIGEFVVELLLSDSRLRNAETAKSRSEEHTS